MRLRFCAADCPVSRNNCSDPEQELALHSRFVEAYVAIKRNSVRHPNTSVAMLQIALIDAEGSSASAAGTAGVISDSDYEPESFGATEAVAAASAHSAKILSADMSLSLELATDTLSPDLGYCNHEPRRRLCTT